MSPVSIPAFMFAAALGWVISTHTGMLVSSLALLFFSTACVAAWLSVNLNINKIIRAATTGMPAATNRTGISPGLGYLFGTLLGWYVAHEWLSSAVHWFFTPTVS